MKKETKIKAKELDKKFDDGEDVSEYFDWTKAKRLKQESRSATPSDGRCRKPR